MSWSYSTPSVKGPKFSFRLEIRMVRRLLSRMLRDHRSLGAISVILLLGMLIACLWPFHAPGNTTSWVTAGHGIAFGRHGVLLGSDRLILPGSQETASFSLELLLRTDPFRDKGSILGVYSAENPRLFSIGQVHGVLALQGASAADRRLGDGASFQVSDVFAPGKAVFISITSDERGTKVYIDGIFRKAAPGFRITNSMFSGTLVCGTSPVSGYHWAGQLLGLAISASGLTPAQVLKDYTSWTGRGRPNISNPDALLALYLFEEGAGNRLRSEVPGGSDLYMPERYFVPAKAVLSPPSLDDWDDILANIIGFLPFGFTLCGFLSSFRPTRIQIMIVFTTVICGGLSLSIESLQAFLPTRDSSMTDVITNLLGGALGALMYRWYQARA
jgi:VanZ family protein